MLALVLSALVFQQDLDLKSAITSLEHEVSIKGVDQESKWNELLAVFNHKMASQPSSDLERVTRWVKEVAMQDHLSVREKFGVLNDQKSSLFNFAAGGDGYATVFFDGGQRGPKLWLLDSGLAMSSDYVPAEVDVWRTKERLTIVGVFSNGGNAPPNGVRTYGFEESLGGWFGEDEILTDNEVSERPVIHVVKGQAQLQKIVCTVRAYPQVLSQCHACPHLLVRETWTQYGASYLRHQEFVETPLLALDEALLALKSGRTDRARTRVTSQQFLSQLRSFLMEGVSAATANSNSDQDRATTYDLRTGNDLTYRATFVQKKGRWLLATLKKR